MTLRTTRETRYAVRPYWRTGGVIRAGQVRPAANRAGALRDALLLSEVGVGAEALTFEADTLADWCGEPRVIASYGEVPEAA